MRTLYEPGGLRNLLLKGGFIDRIRARKGLPKLDAKGRAAFNAETKRRVEGGDNPNKAQQAVRNARKKGETFGQASVRLGSSGDTFGGN